MGAIFLSASKYDMSTCFVTVLSFQENFAFSGIAAFALGPSSPNSLNPEFLGLIPTHTL